MSNFKISDGIVLGSNGVIFSDGSTQTKSTSNASNITSGTLDANRLATSGVTPGVYGDANNVVQFTVDNYGRVTSVANVAVSGGDASATYTIETIAANTEVVVEDLSKLYLCENSEDIYLTLPIATEADSGWNFKILPLGTGNVNIQVTNSEIDSIIYDNTSYQTLQISVYEDEILLTFANTTFESIVSTSTYSVNQDFGILEIICISNTQFVIDGITSNLEQNVLAQAAYDEANAAFEEALSAFDQANTATSLAQASYDEANSAYDQANTATSLAQASYDQANTATSLVQDAYDEANSASTLAQASYDQANTGTSLAQASYDQANTGTSLAQDAYDEANSASTLAQASYDYANTITTGNTTFANGSFTNLSVTNEPVNSTDVANKLYVDTVAEGLRAKPAVEVVTTSNLSATYDNGANGVGATLTSSTNGAWPEIDGVTITSTTFPTNGILVAGQTSALQNGRYNLTTLGDGSNPWVLTRCGLCDEDDEVPGSYSFVKQGTTYGGTGWVQTVVDPDTFTVGTDAIIVTQFTGTGEYTAGTGLNLNTYEFSLANTAVTPGAYGGASAVSTIVVDQQGRITSATNTSIAISSGAVSGLATSATTDTTNANNISSGTLPDGRFPATLPAISGTNLTNLNASNISSGTIANTLLASTGVSAGVYGDATNVAQFTVDQYGRVTAVSNVEISGGGGGGNAFTTIAVSGQSSVVADSSTDTLTLVSGSGISITTNESADSVTISYTGGAGGGITTGKAIAMAIVFG